MYRVKDSTGTTSANVATVSVTVTPAANQAPQVGTPPFLVGNVDATAGVVSGTVNVSDPDEDSLSYSLGADFDAELGWVDVDSATGAWTYTPSLTALIRPVWGVDGYDTLTFTVEASDGQTSVPVVVEAPVGVSTDALLDLIEIQMGSSARAIFAIAIALGLEGLVGDLL